MIRVREIGVLVICGAVLLCASSCTQKASQTAGSNNETDSPRVNLEQPNNASPTNIRASLPAVPAATKTLNVELLVIDLSTCSRCVPTGEQLKAAVGLLEPVAGQLGIELRYIEHVVTTPEEAKARALLSSPTIRLNGRDMAQDIRESACASCGDLTANDTVVDCREWHYRGEVFTAAPLPMLLEQIMQAMIKIDELPMDDPPPLEVLPANLQKFFANKEQAGCSTAASCDPSCCGTK